MDIYDIKFRINPIQEAILDNLYDEGTRLVSELREDIGKDRFKEGSRGHHPDKLEQWGLIKVVDREGPHDERRYGLTPLGDEYVKRERGEIVSPSEGLEDRIDELERTVQQQADEIECLSEEKVDVGRFEALTNQLDNEYKEHLIETIIDCLEQ